MSYLLPFHTVSGVLQARILEWIAISFLSGPCFVRTLHYDPSILGPLHSMAHSFIELCKSLCRDKAAIHEGDWPSWQCSNKHNIVLALWAFEDNTFLIYKFYLSLFMLLLTDTLNGDLITKCSEILSRLKKTCSPLMSWCLHVTEPKVDKVWLGKLEEDSRSCGDCTHVYSLRATAARRPQIALIY